MSKLSGEELKARFSQVKLLALDVDGVMTDGGLYYTENGEELRKFNVKDGMGIKLLQKAGIAVAVISNSTCPATKHRMRKLGIEYTFWGVEDKLAALEELCTSLGLSLDQVAYMGDDVIDLSILRAIGCPLTVADALPANLDCAIYITQRSGGQGAVREVCDLLLSSIEAVPAVLDQDVPMPLQPVYVS